MILLGILRLFFFVIIVLMALIPHAIRSLWLSPDTLMKAGARVRVKMIPWLQIFMGVRIHSKGTPPTEPGLIVSNHRTYIDPAPVAKFIPVIPIVKAEVAKWPLIGWGMRLTGTMYVKRDDKSSRRAVRATLKKLLRKELFTIVYPEGTTHVDRWPMEFRPGAFVAAAEAGRPVHPAYVDYKDQGIAWANGENFIHHFLGTFSRWTVPMYIEWGPSIQSEDPMEMRDHCYNWVSIRMKEFTDREWPTT